MGGDVSEDFTLLKRGRGEKVTMLRGSKRFPLLEGGHNKFYTPPFPIIHDLSPRNVCSSLSINNLCIGIAREPLTDRVVMTDQLILI